MNSLELEVKRLFFLSFPDPAEFAAAECARNLLFTVKRKLKPHTKTTNELFFSPSTVANDHSAVNVLPTVC